MLLHFCISGRWGWQWPVSWPAAGQGRAVCRGQNRPRNWGYKTGRGRQDSDLIRREWHKSFVLTLDRYRWNLAVNIQVFNSQFPSCVKTESTGGVKRKWKWSVAMRKGESEQKVWGFGQRKRRRKSEEKAWDWFEKVRLWSGLESQWPRQRWIFQSGTNCQIKFKVMELLCCLFFIYNIINSLWKVKNTIIILIQVFEVLLTIQTFFWKTKRRHLVMKHISQVILSAEKINILKHFGEYQYQYRRTSIFENISQVILSAEKSSGKFSDRVLLLGEGDQVWPSGGGTVGYFDKICGNW